MIEIISAATIMYDRKTKFDLYQKFGVPEYWIVDPAYSSIEVYRLEDSQYNGYSFAAKTGEIQSAIFKGLNINLQYLTE